MIVHCSREKNEYEKGEIEAPHGKRLRLVVSDYYSENRSDDYNKMANGVER